jgi:DNA-binding NarL/FixJ family response regulator
MSKTSLITILAYVKDEGVIGSFAKLQSDFKQTMDTIISSNIPPTLTDPETISPDIVFVEMGLPNDFLGSVRHLKELFPKAFIIVITFVGDSDLLRRAHTAGMYTYIFRPIVFDELIDLIHKLMQENS